jgi:spore coat polysaccharide biosynthesis protein SpsF
MDEMMDGTKKLTDMPGVITVIQARTNARRLPGKVMLPLGGITVLEQVIRRAQASGLNGPIVVAVPDGEEDQGLRNLCNEFDIPYFVGSETDVLERILNTAHAYEARIVVRCQASHPLLDPKMLWASARYAYDSGMDYVTVARLPEGVACEAVPVRTLEMIAKLTNEPMFREQVTTYTSLRPDLFERAHLPPPPRLSRPDLHLALETEQDYWFLKRLYEEITPDANGILHLDDVIAAIDDDPLLRRHSSEGYAVVLKAA